MANKSGPTAWAVFNEVGGQLDLAYLHPAEHEARMYAAYYQIVKPLYTARSIVEVELQKFDASRIHETAKGFKILATFDCQLQHFRLSGCALTLAPGCTEPKVWAPKGVSMRPAVREQILKAAVAAYQDIAKTRQEAAAPRESGPLDIYRVPSPPKPTRTKVELRTLSPEQIATRRQGSPSDGLLRTISRGDERDPS